MDEETVDVYVGIVRETEKAWLVTDGMEEYAIWIPKSQVEFDKEDPEEGDTVLMTIPKWLAIDKGLV